MSDAYERACREYARRKMGRDDIVIISAAFEFEPGYSYSTYTSESDSFDLNVRYREAGADIVRTKAIHLGSDSDDFGSIMRELVAITAEQSASGVTGTPKERS